MIKPSEPTNSSETYRRMICTKERSQFLRVVTSQSQSRESRPSRSSKGGSKNLLAWMMMSVCLQFQPMKAIAQTTTSHGESETTGMQVESVDWKGFCRQWHNVQKQALISLAKELGLPMGKLDPRQSALLYHQAYSRFVGVAQ